MAKRTAVARKLETVSSDDPWPALWGSFVRGLQAEHRSKRTVEIYSDGAHTFHEWSLANNLPTDPAKIEKQQVEEFVIWLHDEGAKPATVRARFSTLRRFFNWCIAEEIIEHSPMARMRGPKVDETETEPLSEDELNRLLQACHGTRFEDRRDMAIIRLMVDSGLRRGEVSAIMVEDLDVPGKQVKITRKGGREGFGIFGAKTARDLERYLRARAGRVRDETVVVRDGKKVHPLWLAQKGGLTGDGVHFVIKRRAQQAGITKRVWPHLMRHTYGHMMKAGGMSDENLMTLGGWRDAKSMRVYGRGARFERARQAHEDLSPGDRLR
jgi:site-specific recombinase XerD